MSGGTRVRRAAPRRLPVPVRNFYHTVLAEAESGLLPDAGGRDGLDDEIALLRVQIRRQVLDDPDNLDLLLKSLRVLSHLVSAQHRLTDEERADLDDRFAALAQEMAAIVLEPEVRDGRPS